MAGPDGASAAGGAGAGVGPCASRLVTQIPNAKTQPPNPKSFSARRLGIGARSLAFGAWYWGFGSFIASSSTRRAGGRMPVAGVHTLEIRAGPIGRGQVLGINDL